MFVLTTPVSFFLEVVCFAAQFWSGIEEVGLASLLIVVVCCRAFNVPTLAYGTIVYGYIPFLDNGELC